MSDDAIVEGSVTLEPTDVSREDELFISPIEENRTKILEELSPLESKNLSPQSCDCKVKDPTRNHRLAIWYSILYGALSAASALLVKFLTEFSVFFLVLIVGTAMLIVTVICLFYWRLHPFPSGSIIRLLLLSITFVVLVLGRFYSFVYLPVADALAITYFQPVLVMAFSAVFLRESCGFFHIMACCASTGGTFLLVQPSFIFGDAVTENLNPKGIGAALSVALCLSLTTVIVRGLRDLPKSIVLLHSYSIPTILSVVVVGVTRNVKVPTADEYVYIAGLVVCVLLSQLCNVRALQLGDANLVTIVRMVEIVFAFALQMLVLRVPPSLLSILGSVLVVGSAMILAVYSYYERVKK